MRVEIDPTGRHHQPAGVDQRAAHAVGHEIGANDGYPWPDQSDVVTWSRSWLGSMTRPPSTIVSNIRRWRSSVDVHVSRYRAATGMTQCVAHDYEERLAGT
jgi:hypothetical protein